MEKSPEEMRVEVAMELGFVDKNINMDLNDLTLRDRSVINGIIKKRDRQNSAEI